MPRYLKKDSELGYVEDNAEIEYLKFNNMRHTILGCMLGDFDEDGRYVVDPEIVRELIAMRKYVVETMDNIEICLSELKLDKQISFSVTFEGNCATLCLIEKLNYEGNFKINSGAYSNINEYVLDVIETSGVVDKNIVYKRWNIGEYSGSVLDVFNMDEETLAQYFGLVNRFKYLMKANQILLEREGDIEAIETKYAMETLNLVGRFPKLKKEVEKQLKQELKDKKNLICVDKPYFAKTFNEVVSQIVDSNITLLDEAERKEYDVEKHNINNNYNIQMRDTVDTKQERVSDHGEEYTKYTLDTKRAEEHETITETANEFVKAQQSIKNRKRKEAELAFENPRGIDLNNILEGVDPIDILRAFILARLGYDILNNVATPFEKKQEAAKTEAKAETKDKTVTAETPKAPTVDKEKPSGGNKKDKENKKGGGSNNKGTSNKTAANKNNSNNQTTDNNTDTRPSYTFTTQKTEKTIIGRRVATLDSQKRAVKSQERVVTTVGSIDEILNKDIDNTVPDDIIKKMNDRHLKTSQVEELKYFPLINEKDNENVIPTIENL